MIHVNPVDNIKRDDHLLLLDCFHWTRYPASQQMRQNRISGMPVVWSPSTQPELSHTAPNALARSPVSQTNGAGWLLPLHWLFSLLHQQVPINQNTPFYVIYILLVSMSFSKIFHLHNSRHDAIHPAQTEEKPKLSAQSTVNR